MFSKNEKRPADAPAEGDKLEHPKKARSQGIGGEESEREAKNKKKEIEETEKAEHIPLKWKWIVEVFSKETKHLPEEFLPRDWDKTQVKHMKYAYDPKSKKAYDTEEKIIIEKKSIRFIQAPPGSSEISSGEHVSAPLAHGLSKAEQRKEIVTDTHRKKFALCMVDGHYVEVGALEDDHIEAKKNFLDKQLELIAQLNDDPDLAKAIMKWRGMDNFFIKTNFGEEQEEKYYGTYFFYEFYHNDIHNLWLICNACNKHKSAKNMVQWFSEQWAYGGEFLSYLREEGMLWGEEIFSTIGDRCGLAEVATTWFFKRHACYLSTSKQLFEEIQKPLFLLGQKIDAEAIKNKNTEKAARLDASRVLKLALMKKTAAMPSEKFVPDLGAIEKEKGKKISEALLQASTLRVSDERSGQVAEEGAERLKAYLKEDIEHELLQEKSLPSQHSSSSSS